MSNRRADIAAFQRDAGRELLTYLIDAVPDDKLLGNAIAYWRAGISSRRPICFGCRAAFAEGVPVGAYLLAVPVSGAPIASVSGLCSRCWGELPPAAIERRHCVF
jgi:hypothetical protein